MRSPLLLAIALFVLAGCGVPPARDRATLARDIASPAGFAARRIAATPFTLAAWERVQTPGRPATVYIEGDGLAWISRTQPSRDPTPSNPVALRLAVRDKTDNVVYLARPCQYGAEKKCEREYWTDARFSPEVIHAAGKALDDIKRRHRVAGFHLVGFSGGGAVAALLAAQRKDVLSLRTVAGNLDTDAFTQLHHVSPLEGSLNPADIAQKIRGLPQRHFAGARDRIIPPVIGNSFMAASKNPECLRLTILPQVSHEKGWEEAWPEILRLPLLETCG